MTGIDKHFDYVVLPSLGALEVGDRVRIDLNGRRVGGWVTSLASRPSSGLDMSSLRPVVSRSGHGVDSSVVELCRWVADTWCGPFRAVLSSASAPTTRSRVAHPRHGSMSHLSDDPVSTAVRAVRARGGGVVRVPPAASALSAVTASAEHGPVLVVCPTQRMARLGAASLRRRGLGVACLPDEWAHAAAGADVVIGARSAVFAPCPGMATIVVIDEHDEVLKEERSPSWDAASVAAERARRAGVPLVCTSPVPSADAHARWAGDIEAVKGPAGWPVVVVEDLDQLSVKGSLLGGALLAAARDTTSVTLAVLNTKGRARLLACAACSALQRCDECRSLLSDTADGLHCERCRSPRASICGDCGRTSFRVVKTGTAGLCSQIERSIGRRPVEVTAETPLDGMTGGLFVGTEAVLRRIDHADSVIFCDIDRDLGAPRVTAPREVLADIARAARVVGTRGTVVIQSRDPSHPVLQAVSSADPDAALADYLARDVATRETLGLPPFTTLVVFSAERPLDLVDVPSLPGVDWFTERDSLVARVSSVVEVADVVAAVTGSVGHRVRVHVAPSRH